MVFSYTGFSCTCIVGRCSHLCLAKYSKKTQPHVRYSLFVEKASRANNDIIKAYAKHELSEVCSTYILISITPWPSIIHH